MAAVDSTDGINNVIWLTGAAWRYSSGTLALTTVAFSPSNEIVDADMEVNDNVNWTDNDEPTSYDYQSVLLHEAGHFLGLAHTPDFAAVMYATVNLGTHKLFLTSMDTTDVCAVYPGAPGGQGYRCTSASQCTVAGLVCEGPPGGPNLCTQDCTAAGQSCPQGYTCQPSTAGYACLTQVGATDLCKFCASGAECSTGLCLTDGTGMNWCSLNCQSAAQCGSGFTCPTTAVGNVCVPSARCTSQCTGTGQSTCAVGYACSSGTCMPTGNTGDCCELSAYCKPCNSCVADPADPTIAFCRTCCAGTGECNRCANGPCAAGTTCTALSNGTDSICLPSSGSAVCGGCSAASPCSAGLVCITGAGGTGRCHAGCTPSSPGACAACADSSGAGNWVCACPGEISTLGEPCGLQPSLLACATGLSCVSGVCRASCDPLRTSSCPSGQTCTVVGGQGVCMPGSAGNRCAACSSVGTCATGLTCNAQRCYSTCNVNVVGACPSCVQTDASGNGVCACDNQLVGTYKACGSIPDIAACAQGLKCVSGVCRPQCDPNVGCPALMECKPYAGGNYCLDYVDPFGGGGGSTGGGSGSAGGAGHAGGTGGGGGSSKDQGCGCSSPGAAALWPLGLVALGWRRRRARAGGR